MNIDPTKVRIPYNYVLILPDEGFKTYQMQGRETKILVALVTKDDKGTEKSLKEQHLSISGEVWGIPDRLVFNAQAIWSIQDRTDLRKDAYIRPKEYQREIDHLRAESVRFDVPMDLKLGDKVYFEYTAHRDANNEGRWVDTTKGRMMMVKYDSLILAKRQEDIIMLNGYCLIENEVVEKKKIEISYEGNSQSQKEKWNIEGVERASGIILVENNKTEKKSRMSAIGVLHEAGSRVSCYMDFRNVRDGFAKKGDRVCYDPRHARELEYGLHQVFSDTKLRIIQRKDIYGIFE